jgi:hypothetical protein
MAPTINKHNLDLLASSRTAHFNKINSNEQHISSFQSYQQDKAFFNGFTLGDYSRMTREQKLLTMLLDNEQLNPYKSYVSFFGNYDTAYGPNNIERVMG